MVRVCDSTEGTALPYRHYFTAQSQAVSEIPQLQNMSRDGISVTQPGIVFAVLK
jgi:hypothetical protein